MPRTLFQPLLQSARAAAVCAAAFASAQTTAHAQAPVIEPSSAGDLRIEAVAGPFEHPWALAFIDERRILVTERPGRLKLVTIDGAVVDLPGAPEVFDAGQGGLLDVALAADFAQSGVIYLSFAEPAGGGAARTAVARGRLVLGSEPRLEDVQTIWRMEPALRGGRHFGSRIVVDADGAIFVTLGDRAAREESQNLRSHIGSIIRLTPGGRARPDNPFVGRGDALPEIWSYGHRNIQGATLDPATGLLWTVEHGARGGDELNQPRIGRNYGWPVISYGRHYSGARIGVGQSAPGMEQPEYYWDPSIAPSGLMIYSGALFEEWRGDVFVGALRFQLIARLDRDESGRIRSEERLFAERFGRVRDVREGPLGAIWFVTDAPNGALYRVTPAER